MPAEPEHQIILPIRPFPIRLALAAATLAALLLLGGFVYWKLFRVVPVTYADDVENFKYGSIGTNPSTGLPYYIWMVLPRIFPEYLPGNGGYASVGMTWEPGHETPVGFTKMTIGFPRIAVNCAACHSAPFRKHGESVPTIYPGAPAHQFNPQAFLRFLAKSARDDRFNADIILKEIEYFVPLSKADRALYRYVIIPRTRASLLEQAKGNSWQDTRPDWGCGRIDPFNPVKFGTLKMDPSKDTDGQNAYQTVGNSDMEPIWGMKGRDGTPLHWDGLESSLEEVVISGAIGDGTAMKDVDYPSLKRLQKIIEELPVPPFPYEKDQNSPYRRDEKRIRRGAEVYESAGCAECHAPGRKRTYQVIPIEEVQTDPERHKLWGKDAAARYNDYAKGYPWKFSKFVGTNGPGGGYVSPDLRGIWLRAPYLHNGSVPTLRDLLEPPAKRRDWFYRGNDEYDPVKGGWVADQPRSDVNDGRPFTPFNVFAYKYGKKGEVIEKTPVKGNGNGGHLWGVDLPAEDKDALVEYLKSL